MGPLGISQGNITTESATDFTALRSEIKTSGQIDCPRTQPNAYGGVNSPFAPG
jgi:hypothetical protein